MITLIDNNITKHFAKTSYGSNQNKKSFFVCFFFIVFVLFFEGFFFGFCFCSFFGWGGRKGGHNFPELQSKFLKGTHQEYYIIRSCSAIIKMHCMKIKLFIPVPVTVYVDNVYNHHNCNQGDSYHSHISSNTGYLHLSL